MRYALALIVILNVSPVLGAVSISTANWSGTLDNGTSITLGGTGFGSKTSTGSLVYDTFDSGSFDSWWAATNDVTLINLSTSQRNTNSTYTQFLNFRSGSRSARLQGEGTSHEKWGCSGFFKFSNFDWGTSGFEGGDQWLSNVKGPWRLWNAGAEADNWFMQYAGDENRLKADTEAISPGQSDTVIGTMRTNLVQDTWHQFELQWQDSSVGSSDGTLKIWYDGALAVSDTSFKSRDGGSVFKRIHTMGFSDSWGVGGDAEGDQAPNEYWADDFYCDDNWSAVFVSTGSTFVTGGHREYGVVTSWNTTEVVFNFHEGSWVAGTDTLYVYVRDADGVVNSSGRIMDGEGGGGDDSSGFTVDEDLKALGYKCPCR